MLRLPVRQALGLQMTFSSEGSGLSTMLVLLASQMVTAATRMVHSTVHSQLIPVGIGLWMQSQLGWWCWARVAIVQGESAP